jgi:hypothetical protein
MYNCRTLQRRRREDEIQEMKKMADKYHSLQTLKLIIRE